VVSESTQQSQQESSPELAVTPSWGRRLIGMEGLRGAAAISVLMGHVQVHLASGVDFGVGGRVLAELGHGLTLFFALSGFLLFRPFASALLTGRRFPDVPRFLLNRVLRIWPAYLVIFALVSFVLGVAYTEPAGRFDGVAGTDDSVGYLTDPLKIVVNLFLAQTFFPFSLKTGLGAAWSLSVELIFYLVLPVVAMLAGRLGARGRSGQGRPHPFRFALIPVLALLAIGWVGKAIMFATFHPADATERFFLLWGGDWYAVFARSFLVHADLFAFGMLAALLVAAAEAGMLREPWIARLRWAVLGLGVVAVIVSRFAREWNDSAWAAAFGALILFIALPARTGAHGRLASVLERAPFRFLGLISYSIYLWHLPVLWMLERAGWIAPATAWGYPINVVIVTVVVVALSTLTYFFVEKPPLRLKRRTDGSKPQESQDPSIKKRRREARVAADPRTPRRT
jgi:peptidoglycan/LPS O-acetylase OafA/YrhL